MTFFESTVMPVDYSNCSWLLYPNGSQYSDTGLSSNYTCSDIFNVATSPAPSIDETLVLFRDRSRFWVQRVLVPLIMIIGVIGNVVTIFIMTRRRMRSSTNIYLAALAIFDMLYLIFIFALSIAHYPKVDDPDFYVYWRVWPFALMLTDACSNTSVWLTVTFTFERYIAVSYPIKGKVFCTESRAKKAIIAVSFICFTFTLPTPFEWNIIERTDPLTNKTRLMPAFSDLGLNHIYKSVYYWLTVVLFILIPFFLLAIFNAFLIRSVHISKKERKTMTGRQTSRDSSRQENKITVMLIAVVMLFFFCQLPTAVILLYTSFKNVDPVSNEGALLRGLGNIFNFLMAINAAGNFVLYCLLSQKYRRTFLQTFCPCLKGKITRLHSVYQHTMYSNVDNSSPATVRKTTARAIGLRKTYNSGEGLALEKIDHSRKNSYNLDPDALKPLRADCNNSQSVDTCADCSIRLDQVECHTPSTTSIRKKNLSNTLLERLKCNSIENKANIQNGNSGQGCIIVTSPSGTWNSSL